MDTFKIINKELKEVESVLNEQVSSEIDFLFNSATYILKSGGKRLRPALLLLSSKACGFTGHNKTINLACALELIHTATLIHDDIIDESTLRRNKQTFHSRYNNKLAVLLGDYFYSKAVSLIIADGNKQIMETVANTVSQICEGEILQTLKANTLIKEPEYLDMITKKTASFFSCCCLVGSLIGDAPLQMRDSLASYGLNLGIAFQINDDILDLVSDETKTGKSTKNDLLNGKFTLPIIHVVEYLTPSEIEILAEGREKKEVMRLIEKYGGLEYSQNKIQNYVNASKQHLNLLNHSPYKEALMSLTDEIVSAR